MRESVRGELERLLNTRRPAPPGDPRQLTVLDYGIPDFSHLSPASSEDRAELAALVAQAVAAFEPRLSQVRVVVRGWDEVDRSLELAIDARLAIGALSEPVSFPTRLGVQGGGARVEPANLGSGRG